MQTQINIITSFNENTIIEEFGYFISTYYINNLKKIVEFQSFNNCKANLKLYNNRKNYSHNINFINKIYLIQKNFFIFQNFSKKQIYSICFKITSLFAQVLNTKVAKTKFLSFLTYYMQKLS